MATLGVYAGHALNNPCLDGVASLLIGVILTLTAAFLTHESKSLFINESADPDVFRRIRTLVQTDAAILNAK